MTDSPSRRQAAQFRYRRRPQGRAQVPGDKSISHRSLMLGALAVGESEIHGLLEGGDVLRTAAAMRLPGRSGGARAGRRLARGGGIGGLAEADDVLDLGNAGTGTRLLMGLVAPLSDDDVLHRRCLLAQPADAPRRRALQPHGRGCSRAQRRQAALAVIGAADRCRFPAKPVASAQVKSAVLLAGLHAQVNHHG